MAADDSATMHSTADNATAKKPITIQVTLRVHRYTPSMETTDHRARTSSPFAKSSSPFEASSSSPFGGPSPRVRARRMSGKRWIEEYTIEAQPEETILECLLTVKRTKDPTLAFRYACGHGMCGSDAVSVNGTPTLLCTATVGDWIRPSSKTADARTDGAAPNSYAADFAQSTPSTPSTPSGASENTAHARFRRTKQSPIGSSEYGSSVSAMVTGDHAPASSAAASPDLPQGHADDAQARADTHTGVVHEGVIELAALPGFPVERDLMVNMESMFSQIEQLDTHLRHDGIPATTNDSHTEVHEYLQTPEELQRYELLSDCIACGVCESSCPVYAGGEAFVGPAALVMASRFINDSRDTAAAERLEAVDTEDGILACQSVRACSRQCPRGIDVGEEMWQLTTKVNQR